MNRFYRNLLVSAGLVSLIAACQEQLTAPGSCPETCPGGTPVVHDTVLDAILDGDSTYSGYLNPGSSPQGLLVANGFQGATQYGVIRFISRPDTLSERDTVGGKDSARTYVIDSVAIELSLLARDTSVSGINLAFHRIPATTDTGVTFAEIDPLIVPGTLIDSVTIDDTIGSRYRFVFRGDTLDSIAIPAADSGVLAIAVAISGATQTGVRVGGISSGASYVPRFITYVTLNIQDTTTAVRKQLINRGPSFTRYVSSVAPPSDPDILYIGNSNVSRGFIRFPWPAYLRDSALLARATIEVTPTAPINGLPGDSVILIADGVRVDYGPKSPPSNLLQGGSTYLSRGSSDTVRIDVINEVVLWQTKATSLPHPPIFFLSLLQEGSSFTTPSFYSSRSPGVAPRLRVTYQLPFDFERP